MRRRGVAAGLAAATLLLPGGPARAPVPTVGILLDEPAPDTVPAFREALGALGWPAGARVTLVERYAQGVPDLHGRHVDELLRLGPAVLVAASPAAIEAARRASARVPIVMVSVDDPAARGWVPDLARPAANLTGVTFALPELPGRRVDWLARLVPGLREVAVLTNPANPSATAEAAELGRAAAGRGLAVTTVGLRPDVRFKDTLGAVERAKPGGLLVATDAVLVAEREAIARFAARQRLPAVYPLAEFVEAGGLAALGGERAEAFRGAARYAARLLDGARPADLPVERVARIELVVNLKAARAARLSVPEAVLRGAARVVP